MIVESALRELNEWSSDIEMPELHARIDKENAEARKTNGWYFDREPDDFIDWLPGDDEDEERDWFEDESAPVSKQMERRHKRAVAGNFEQTEHNLQKWADIAQDLQNLSRAAIGNLDRAFEYFKKWKYDGDEKARHSLYTHLHWYWKARKEMYDKTRNTPLSLGDYADESSTFNYHRGKRTPEMDEFLRLADRENAWKESEYFDIG